MQSLFHVSPELFSGLPYTDKCDIYSAAIVFSEMVTRVVCGSYKRPFVDHPQLKFEYQIFYHAAKRNLRPTLLPGTPIRFSQLINRCWDPESTKRPTAAEILPELSAIRKELLSGGT